MTVLFHGNFPLDRSRMSGLMLLALEQPDLKDKELAKPFGYGAPFAAIYRSWLHKTGLTKMGLPLELTECGRIILKNDPSLDSMVTKWFLHHELISDPERAEAWHYFALEFLPKVDTFNKEDLLIGLSEKLSPHSMKHFGPGSKLNKQIANKIIQVYTEKNGLGDLGLIHKDGERYMRKHITQIGPWPTQTELKKAYND